MANNPAQNPGYPVSAIPDPASPTPDPVSTALYTLASLAGRAHDAGSAAHTAFEVIRQTLRAQSGGLLLLNPDTSRLELEVHHNLPADDNRLAFDLGQGLPGWVALHAQPLLAADAGSDLRYRAVRPDVRSQMAVPLLADEQVLGVIVLDRLHPAAGFVPEDLDLLVRLTDEAARALRRLWHWEQLQGKARQLETLITTGQSLVAKLEPQELFDALTRDARQMLGSRAAALYLHDPGRETMRCVSLAAGSIIPLPAGDLPVSACLTGVTVNTRRQAEFADVQSAEFNGLADIPAEPGLRSVLVTPLIYEQEVLGALAVFGDRIRRFDNDAKRLCAGLASLGAVALQNARLYARAFQSEETLRKNERLTTLGLLAAEIAHEIRNPLTVLKLLHGGLGLDFADGDPRRTDMRVIGEKLDQLESIVTRVLQFGKTTGSLHSRWALADLVQDTLVLLRPKLAQAKVQCRFEPPAQPVMVEVHKGQLQQVLLNLLLNSMQAMPEGGLITLTLGTTGPAATLDLTDTGGGIAPGLQPRIFDSFLSGREDGTGLGLAIAKRVMLSHHGDITLVSTDPAGTTMRLTLPFSR
ncbi:MAG TPA: GAF domain-containing protein [Opitutaceae bacterium]|nr:GAF domain-containing protein [Opitutaceae bacterium]HRJ46647.1 GAF domain-containing protein [Opitutaceae bacterium]